MSDRETTTPGKGKPEKKKRTRLSRALSWVADLVFYALVLASIAFLAAVYLTSDQEGGTKTFFGYSAYTVLTGSMQSEIPQESFVLVKTEDPNTLAVGDDITFLRENRDVVTHKIIGIYEDYNQSGMRGFQTKGVENPEPDREIVYADNVVGKVVYHSLWLGSLLSYARTRVWLVVVMAVLIIAFFAALRRLSRVWRRKSLGEADDVTTPPAEAGREEPQAEPSPDRTPVTVAAEVGRSKPGAASTAVSERAKSTDRPKTQNQTSQQHQKKKPQTSGRKKKGKNKKQE